MPGAPGEFITSTSLWSGERERKGGIRDGVCGGGSGISKEDGAAESRAAAAALTVSQPAGVASS